MNIDLKQLGFTQEELQERVVERICDQLLTSIDYDPDSGEESPIASRFQQAIRKEIQARIDTTIAALGERYVLPRVSQFIEELVIQETNAWGEKKGAPVTIIEYLVQRAQAYMQEEVDSNGRSKAECSARRDSFYSTKQTRITHAIHHHLHLSIEAAMKESLKLGMGELAKGLHETARMKLNEIAASMKVQVSTK